MALLPVADALERLLAGTDPLEKELVPLAAASGRVLAGPLRATRTQPPFAAAAMDGYAVRAADVGNLPARLRVLGIAAAGRRFPGTVGPGSAVRIFTGAPVPEGADAIAIQENTASAGDLVELLQPVVRGAHIRRPGLDFSEGDVLLDEGRLLDPAALALAAAANHPQVEVVGRPLVAIIATGDELLPPGSATGPDQIIASNNFGVAAIAEAAGGRVLDLGIAADRLEAISTLVQRATEAEADVIVTLGGASVGDHDLVRDVLAGLGMQLDFWKIAMRPGKPLMFGRLGRIRCIGLPGNPVASLICARLFLEPLLARLGGRRHVPRRAEAALGAALPANDLREDYVRARIDEEAGRLVATPFPIQDSSMLKLLAEAGGLIVREPFAPAAKSGEPCQVLLLR